MKQTLLIAILLFGCNILISQNNENFSSKYIEVTGSAELEIEPDEIQIIIGIEEYEKYSKSKGNKSKVSIFEIEERLLVELEKIGISNENIIINEVGNYWNYHKKHFLLRKEFTLILHDYSDVNELLTNIYTKGVGYMRIGKLKNARITEYRKQVKIEALKAAKEKAIYLLESIGEDIGEIISIVEVNTPQYGWQPQSVSNIVMPSPDNSKNNNVRKIKLRYEVLARFEIN